MVIDLIVALNLERLVILCTWPLNFVVTMTNTQWATCMRPWIGPNNTYMPIMIEWGMMNFRNVY